MKTRYLALTAAALAAACTGGTTLAASASPPPKVVSATAVTALHARPDSGYGGNNWASDSLTRTFQVTRGAATSGTLCGDAAATDPCWAYSAQLTDTGTAYAVTGQVSPGAQAVLIKGTPSAAVSGSGQMTFYASSGTPDASLVPRTLAGDSVSTSDWPELFFPNTVTFGAGPQFAEGGLDWSWTYKDTRDCQTWYDQGTGMHDTQATSGDITGADSCTTSITNPGTLPGTQGQKFSKQLLASTTSSDKSLTGTATGLPAGLALNKSTGVISGTIARNAVSGPVTVTVSDFGGITASTVFQFNVKPQVFISAGHAQALNAGHALVTWKQTAAAEDRLVITGPGPGGSGHTDWVAEGTSASVTIGSLEGGHTYQVTITPFTARNGTQDGPPAAVDVKTP